MMLHRVFCLTCSIFLIGLINTAHGENNNRKLRLGVKLTDGSYVIGTLDVASLPVRTNKAKTDVDLSNIQTIKFADGVKSVVIRLRNGDQIKGDLMLKRLDLSTIFGKVKIENGQIVALRNRGWLVDPKDAQALFGLTRDDEGKIGIHKVNTTTGKATAIIELIEADFDCYYLAFHAPSRRFLTLSYSTPTLGIFDPNLEKITKVPITGLPVGQQKLSGITYRGDTDQIVITFGSSRGNKEDRVAAIGIDGKVQNVSSNLGLGDRDTICWNPLSGDLLTADFNGTVPRIAAVADPFHRVSTVAWANPPRSSDIHDLAILPTTGQAFTIRFPSRELVEIVQNGDAYSTVGSFGTNANMFGIAVAPADLMERRRK